MAKKAKGERSKVLPEDATGRLRRCVGEGAVEREREEGAMWKSDKLAIIGSYLTTVTSRREFDFTAKWCE